MSIKTNRKKSGFSFFTVILTALLALAIGGGTAYHLGYLVLKGKKPGKKQMETKAAANTGERKIAYWRAPMNPTEIYDKPGKSAMGMDLVPVYEDAAAGGSDISIDPTTQQNMGIRTAIVQKGPLTHTLRTYGHITYDETRVTRINPKFSGWIERLYIDFKGQPVKKGEPLFTIYSPELITAQQDYLEAYQNNENNPSRSNARMLNTVRLRLLYYDLGESEIKTIEKKNAVLRTLTIRSPFAGVVIEKKAFEGGYVKAGAIVYEIADLSVVWIDVHIYEYELEAVHTGQTAEMTLPYMPGKRYVGKIVYVYPYLQKKTRDVVVRLVFNNPDILLKPDMYANIRIDTSGGEVGIQIPDEAVLRTGERNIVFVTRPGNKFAPREVTLGMPLDNGKIQILTGLAEGETVVTSGQFLIDSESKLREAVSKMMDAKKSGKKAEVAPDPASNFFDDVGDTSKNNPFFEDMK
ncbi:MAG: efflux RND transporter periplasmic adaptor subunit [Deltaproteobacteria bacterium]|nr:efflux RND transporter periplasmic adaptor subunit [Deltaproteobacteria bacterium]